MKTQIDPESTSHGASAVHILHTHDTPQMFIQAQRLQNQWLNQAVLTAINKQSYIF